MALVSPGEAPRQPRTGSKCVITGLSSRPNEFKASQLDASEGQPARLGSAAAAGGAGSPAAAGDRRQTQGQTEGSAGEREGRRRRGQLHRHGRSAGFQLSLKLPAPSAACPPAEPRVTRKQAVRRARVYSASPALQRTLGRVLAGGEFPTDDVIEGGAAVVEVAP